MNKEYTPAEKKRIDITEEILAEDKLKRTIRTKFSKIFHPDKNVSAPRHTQILCAEIMNILNTFAE